MKNIFRFLLVLLITATNFAQVGINTETPDDSATLDIVSTTGGLLVPRMTQAQRNNINSANPATGLMVYQIDGAAGFYYFDGNNWAAYYSKTDINELLESLETRLTLLEGPEVGDFFRGGIVAYIFETGDEGYIEGETHGLIVAIQDLPTLLTWGDYSSDYSQFFQDISTDIGFGKSNTDIILEYGAQSGLTFPAAQAAFDYTFSGYNDWFLPSLDELMVIKNNLANNNLGNFVIDPSNEVSGRYWSSSVMQNYAGALAPSLVVDNEVTCGCAYFSSFYVRPVRYF